MAENLLDIKSPEKLWLELEDQLKKEIMSKEMPKMKYYWEKLTTQDIKEGTFMTAAKLKKALNTAISAFCIWKNISKIDGYLLAQEILPQFDPAMLAQYKISLYKNGKTVKVIKKLGKLSFAEVGTFGSVFAPITAKDLTGFGSLGSKKLIMEGKLQELVVFHIERKHALPWENCIACKAIRAFVQWEFHQPVKTNKKKIKSGVAGKTIDTVTAIDKLSPVKISLEGVQEGKKMLKLQEEILKEAANSGLIKSVSWKSVEEEIEDGTD